MQRSLKLRRFRKRHCKELFDQRDRTRPGSREKEQAAEKILEALFPDTNAG
jgi:hypothetical protein